MGVTQLNAGELRKQLENVDDKLPVTFLVADNAMCDDLIVSQVVVVNCPGDERQNRVILSEEPILF